MTTKNYPGGIDSFTTWVDDTDNIVAASTNDVQDQIVVIETELGTDPAGSLTDVKTRLAVSLNDDGTLKQPQRKTITVSAANGQYSFDFTDEGLSDYAAATYQVALTTVGTNAGNAWAVLSGAKATTGFTIALYEPANGGGSQAYDASTNNVDVDVITLYQ